VTAPVTPDSREIIAAVGWLRTGGIVAFPTDTFYGLAVDPRSEAAVRALFALKGRASTSALPLIGASRAQVEQCCGLFPATTDRLAAAFWPGALSLLFDVPREVAPDVHAGSGAVAVRVPAHALATALAEAFGYLITATSANRSGEPAVTTPRALDVFGGDPRLFVLEGGRVPGGAPSTIVDARQTPIRLVREGAIAWSRVLESIKE
jgi:L-threonylcarbamoyladenylate synthase